MDKYKIGTNAGTVWRILDSKRTKMTFGELLAATQLNPADLATAIGWLAREDKIRFEEQDGKEFYLVFQEYYY